MPPRPLMALVLVSLSSCTCSERLIPVSDDDGGAAPVDAGRFSDGAGDAGTADGGARDGGAADAGPADGGRPFELEQALRDCERIESCMLGPSNYNGLNG
jgi:hypothetical protein